MVANFHEKILGGERSGREEAAPALASRFGQEPSLVRTLARVLEPSDMAREGVERAMFVRAAGAAAECGDFCDAFPLDNGSLALIVGDVSGRGAQAAAQVPELRAMLRLALYGDPDPGLALTCLNSALYRPPSENDLESAPFACVSIAVVQPQTDIAVFACAGCEPPMIVSTTAMHRSVRVSGLPLGVFWNTEYETAQHRLAPYDLLIMGTNGIFEAGRPYKPLGTERLVKWANGLVPLHSLRVIGQMLMDEIESFAMGNIPDDRALLLARLI